MSVSKLSEVSFLGELPL